jgi:hypothetical protein
MVYINPWQVICGNDACPVFMWDTTRPGNWLLLNEQPIDGPETEG